MNNMKNYDLNASEIEVLREIVKDTETETMNNMKNYDLNASEIEVLREIVKDTETERGYSLMVSSDFKELEDRGLCESNESIVENGRVAVRATKEGIQLISVYHSAVEVTQMPPVATMEHPEEQPSEAAITESSDRVEVTITEAKAIPTTKTNKTMSNIQIRDVTDVPGITRSIKKNKYPFASLNVESPGNAFFIPATEENPEPWKKIQSSLTNANKMYAVETGGTRINRRGVEVPETVQERKFVARHVYEPSEGVMVIRVK